MRPMPAPVPYLHFPGTAAEALHAYQAVFGGEVQLFTFAEFSRTDAAPDLVAHGQLRGPVDLFAADIAGDEQPVSVEGVLFALLGAADAATSARWFDALAAGGTVLDPLQERPWGDTDGQVRDRYGVTWLIGYQPER